MTNNPVTIKKQPWESEDLKLHPTASFRVGYVPCSYHGCEVDEHPCLSINDEYAVVFSNFDEVKEYLTSLQFAFSEIEATLQ